MRLTQVSFGALVVLVIAVAPLSTALAGGCGYENCWGAVAVGERGRAARATGFRTAPEAWARAERVCGPDCETIEVFNNGCGVIAQDSRGALSTGFATTRADAMAEALTSCEAGTGSACRVRIWACTK